jgi:hypothetical protein
MKTSYGIKEARYAVGKIVYDILVAVGQFLFVCLSPRSISMHRAGLDDDSRAGENSSYHALCGDFWTSDGLVIKSMGERVAR